MHLHANTNENRVPDKYGGMELADFTAKDNAVILANQCIETALKLEINSVDPEEFRWRLWSAVRECNADCRGSAAALLVDMIRHFDTMESENV